MSLPKILPLTETESVIELQSLVLEEKPISLTPIPPRSGASEPNRSRGQLSSEAMRNRDVYDGFVRRPARGIRDDGAAGASG